MSYYIANCELWSHPSNRCFHGVRNNSNNNHTTATKYTLFLVYWTLAKLFSESRSPFQLIMIAFQAFTHHFSVRRTHLGRVLDFVDEFASTASQFAACLFSAATQMPFKHQQTKTAVKYMRWTTAGDDDSKWSRWGSMLTTSLQRTFFKQPYWRTWIRRRFDYYRLLLLSLCGCSFVALQH